MAFKKVNNSVSFQLFIARLTPIWARTGDIYVIFLYSRPIIYFDLNIKLNGKRQLKIYLMFLSFCYCSYFIINLYEQLSLLLSCECFKTLRNCAINLQKNNEIKNRFKLKLLAAFANSRLIITNNQL